MMKFHMTFQSADDRALKSSVEDAKITLRKIGAKVTVLKKRKDGLRELRFEMDDFAMVGPILAAAKVLGKRMPKNVQVECKPASDV